MMMTLTKEQMKNNHDEMADWARQEMEKEHGHHIYNLLLQARQLIEQLERDR